MLLEDMQPWRIARKLAGFIGTRRERVALAAVEAVAIPDAELPDPFHGHDLRSPSLTMR